MCLAVYLQTLMHEVFPQFIIIHFNENLRFLSWSRIWRNMACVIGAFLHITLLCHHCLFSYIQICFYLMNPCFTSSPCFDLLQNRCLALFLVQAIFFLLCSPTKPIITLLEIWMGVALCYVSSSQCKTYQCNAYNLSFPDRFASEKIGSPSRSDCKSLLLWQFMKMPDFC